MSCNSTSADLRPAQYNVKIWRNDSWVQTFALLADTTPIDLSGCTILIQVRPTPASSVVALTLTTADNTIKIGSQTRNQITLNKIVNVAAGAYVYDMNVTFPTGEVKTYLWGNFIVQEDVTKV